MWLMGWGGMFSGEGGEGGRMGAAARTWPPAGVQPQPHPWGAPEPGPHGGVGQAVSHGVSLLFSRQSLAVSTCVYVTTRAHTQTHTHVGRLINT